MKKTAQGLVDWAYSKLGTRYLYGYKGQRITKELNDYFRESYPSVWTQNYYNIANSWIGQLACDCSGLISWYTGKLRGSWEYHDTALEVVEYKGQNLHNYIGWAIWKKGHIGIVVGDNDIIEERGQMYGCVKTKATARDFTHLLKIVDIDYNAQKGTLKAPYCDKYGDITYEAKGWHKDDIGGFWYRYKSGIGPETYYFNYYKEFDGFAITFNAEGYVSGISSKNKDFIEKLINAIE